jgi:hypothetical protein
MSFQIGYLHLTTRLRSLAPMEITPTLVYLAVSLKSGHLAVRPLTALLHLVSTRSARPALLLMKEVFLADWVLRAWWFVSRPFGEHWPPAQLLAILARRRAPVLHRRQA